VIACNQTKSCRPRRSHIDFEGYTPFGKRVVSAAREETESGSASTSASRRSKAVEMAWHSSGPAPRPSDPLIVAGLVENEMPPVGKGETAHPRAGGLSRLDRSKTWSGIIQSPRQFRAILSRRNVRRDHRSRSPSTYWATGGLNGGGELHVRPAPDTTVFEAILVNDIESFR